MNDEMNDFLLHLITFGNYWPQKLPADHTQSLQINKINVENHILYLECHIKALS